MNVTSPAPTETAQRILDVAERLVQTQGFNGFSYADIAAELHVTKASLHYHFATKAQLGAELIARYHATFQHALDEIAAQEPDARRRLRRYAALYAGVLRKDRMCLCGMLASDFATLPRSMKDAVKRFFDANEAWIADVLERGRRARSLRFRGPPAEVARTLVASLEGAMLVARSYGDPARFDAAAERLLAQIGVELGAELGRRGAVTRPSRGGGR